jgi:hypothetical protein
VRKSLHGLAITRSDKLLNPLRFVLDIQKGGKKVTNLVICEKQADNVNQQWYINSDGTIVNANEDGLAVDIGKGNEVIAYQKNGNENQKFHFQDV